MITVTIGPIMITVNMITVTIGPIMITNMMVMMTTKGPQHGGHHHLRGGDQKETPTKRKYRRHGRNTGNSTGKVVPLYMVSKGDSYSLVKVVARLEYAYLANAANENSGSIKQLILDAGLKRNESGFAVTPFVNYEEYYTKAKVSQW